MTIALKINLTDEEKNILSKARELASELGEDLRSMADNIRGLESDIISEVYSQADICDKAWQTLYDLCDEFGID